MYIDGDRKQKGRKGGGEKQKKNNGRRTRKEGGGAKGAVGMTMSRTST